MGGGGRPVFRPTRKLKTQANAPTYGVRPGGKGLKGLGGGGWSGG